MEFCIDKSYFGTDFHLICRENGSVERIPGTEPLPNDVLNISSNKAKELSRLYGFKTRWFPSYKYKKFFYEHFRKPGVTQTPVPWSFVMPKSVYVKEVSEALADLKRNFGQINPDYYEKCFLPQNQIFKELKPAKIDVDSFVNLISEDHDAHLKTFAPTLGYSNPITYSRFSKTGRLKVVSGPMINNITKAHRQTLLKSRFAGGHVYQFDYSSLEPRIFLAIKNIKTGYPNNPIPVDIYSDFITKYELHDIPRDVLKNVILSRLYGAGENLLFDKLEGYNHYPNDIIEMMDEYLGFETIRNEVIETFNNNSGNRIFNFFGRPIDCTDAAIHGLLNYYIQSTAVDVCLFGFNEVVRRVKAAGLIDFIIPVFILHDALFVDIHPKYLFLINKLCRAGSINIPKFESVNFCLKAEKIV